MSPIVCLSLIGMFARLDHGSRAGTATTFDLRRRVIAGGGATFSTGGDWELSGTIGQPEGAIPQPQARGQGGGDFELTGGFWFEVAPTDCNTDGTVNLLDYDPFQPCLTGPRGAPAAGSCRCFDINHSGRVDLADFAVLQASFAGE